MSLAEKINWHLNEWLTQRLGLLARARARLSLISQFTTPGDTLLTGTVGNILKRRWPTLRLNGVVHQPELLQGDPAFESVNGPLGWWQLRFHYLTVIDAKDGRTNLLRPTLERVGIADYEYRARVFLTPAELEAGRRRIAHLTRPIVTVNAMSRESTKTWGTAQWAATVRLLQADFDLVQLGDRTEPEFEGVLSFGGKLSLRESLGVLAHSRVHVGPVSFLMHAANGLDVPAVIIFGGRETPENSGYAANTNLFVPMPCGPCWLHENRGESCQHDMDCMKKISPLNVADAVRGRFATR